MSEEHVFYNIRAKELVSCRVKDLRGECKHSYGSEIIEAVKFLQLDPEKNASRLRIMKRALERWSHMH